jgi:hypothetical protein
MYTKLTLNIEDAVVDQAKDFAHERNVSVSRLVEDFLRSLKRDSKSVGIDADVAALRGSYRSLTAVDTKKIIAKGLTRKYLR